MEEIKVNDYIRTYRGDIGKIKTITSTGVIIENDKHIHFDKIRRYNENATDLVEIKDLIKLENMGLARIFKVVSTDDKYIYGSYETISKKHILEDYEEVAILTWEQFERIKYVIGE